MEDVTSSSEDCTANQFLAGCILRRKRPAHTKRILQKSSFGLKIGLTSSLLVCMMALLSSQSVFRVDVTTVLLEAVVVRSDGSPVRGLTRDKFQIVEDGRKMPLLYFAEANNLPVSLGVLVDESVNNSLLGQIKQFLLPFIHQLKPQDEIALGAYSDDMRLLSPLTTDRLKLVRALDEIYPGAHSKPFRGGGVTTPPQTGLPPSSQQDRRPATLPGIFYSPGGGNTGYAIDEMIAQLRKSRFQRKVILVFSSSFTSLGEATRDHLQIADIFFYSVAAGNDAGARILSLGGDLEAKGRILNTTAGVNFPFIEGDPEFSSRVAVAIQYQYNLGYAFTGTKDLAKRKIEVRVPGTDYRARFKRKLIDKAK
ncbi:MAG TPA: VWA domain-containing protein [Acidobacteriota bacterium]|jgi:VWFA-related protein